MSAKRKPVRLVDSLPHADGLLVTRTATIIAAVMAREFNHEKREPDSEHTQDLMLRTLAIALGGTIFAFHEDPRDMQLTLQRFKAMAQELGDDTWVNLSDPIPADN